MKKTTLISTILGIIIIGGIFLYYQNQQKEIPIELIKVSRGNVYQEVSETGTVKPAEEIMLSFENSGTLKKLYVKEGQKVGLGQLLAELDSEQLQIQLSEARAVQETAQAKLNQLLTGFSEEEIKIAQTTVSNAQTSLGDEEQNLADVKAKAEEDLDEDYEDALAGLDDIYLNSYDALQDVQTVYLAYFSGVLDQDSMVVQENQSNIKTALNQEESFLAAAKANTSYENIDTALSEFKDSLLAISSGLSNVKEIIDKSIYSNTISITHKTTLDSARSDIAEALVDIINSQQTISGTKLTNTTNINKAQAKVNTVKGTLEKAKDELALKTAGPRQVDIDLYEAELRKAEAKVNLLKAKTAKSLMRAPIEGVITYISKEVGEMVKALEPVITLISSKPFQLKADIYEEDISKVKILDEVSISLVAFPEKTLKGKVIAIDPAEKVIEGVVYYEVTIDFETLADNLKPGMTADIIIKTAFRENVLTLAEPGLIEKDGKVFVKVFKAGKIEEREIEIGLKGSDDIVEVISGLEEGEEIAL